MQDLLGALMGGAQQPEPEEENEAQDPLAQLLSGFMGGQQPSQAGTSSAAQDPLAQMLSGFMGGQAQQAYSPPPQPRPAEQAPDMSGLLGSLLGGGGQAPVGYGSQSPADYSGQAGGAPNMGGLLQALLGGGLTPAPAPAPAASGGGLGNILGAILGGGSQAMANDSFLAPIINRLAEKIGLPPQVAQAVVAFVISKLFESRAQTGLDRGPAPVGPSGAGGQAATLQDVVSRMNSGRRVPKTAIRQAGLARELAAYTGLNRATAEASVQEVLNALGGELGGGG